MQAHKLPRESVSAFVESPDGREFLAGIDKRWGEVMQIARECGFIVQAAGGVAVLSTYANMLEDCGAEQAVRMLQMSGVEIPVEA